MSSIRIIILAICVLNLTGCHLLWPADKDEGVVSIKLSSSPNEDMLRKFETLVIDKIPEGFTNVIIISSKEKYKSALELKHYFTDTYDIKSDIIITGEDDGLSVQLERNKLDDCYIYELNDFNWYKSSHKDIENYNQSRLCATNINDRSIQV